tara:strand:- start:716 stop:943 length:228 start_codon:yes stop_codon:yes gene_type:complete
MILFLAALSTAKADEPQVIYKDKTEIDFEAVELEGQLKKPHGEMIVERIKAEFNPLVPIREDFLKEMTQSLNEVK